jgi:hypothetical protein
MTPAAPSARSAFRSPWLGRLNAWRPSYRQVFGAFVAGFLLCWLTLWLGLRQHGTQPFVSPLYGFLLLFVEALRDVLNRFTWLRPTFYPPSLTSLPVLLACAIVGEIFSTAVALARSERAVIRWGGLLLLLVLAVATFSWSRIPPLPKG